MISRRAMWMLIGAANAAIASPPANAESGDWSSPGLGAPEDPTMPKCVPALVCDALLASFPFA